MQDVCWAAGTGGADLGVEIILLPGGEHFGLGHREVRLHGEIRSRQIDGLLQVYALGFHSTSSTPVYRLVRQDRSCRSGSLELSSLFLFKNLKKPLNLSGLGWRLVGAKWLSSETKIVRRLHKKSGIPKPMSAKTVTLHYT